VEDFELEAEWHFTATSHGKSTCDALTAVAKRGARLESLKPNRRIVSALDFFDFCHGKLTKPTLEFFYAKKADIALELATYQERYKSAKSVPGTRSFHAVIPVSETDLQLRLLSLSKDFMTQKITERAELPTEAVVERFVSLLVGDDWKIGQITLVDDSTQECEINCMKRVGRGNKLRLPPMPNCEVYHVSSILCNVHSPTTNNGTDFILDKNDYDLVRRKVKG
jgi:hypothetical protein